MKYGFVAVESSEFTVKRMCHVLGVRRSGYYAWKKKEESERFKENTVILGQIKKAHEASGRVYGSPRITKELKESGVICSKKRIARLMRINGIVSKIKKKFKATTNSRHTLPVAPNLLNRRFEACKPYKVLVSDITYVWTLEGWLYLAVILDLFSRRVVGWAFSNTLKADLVIKAFNMAVLNKTEKGVIFHSDRGVQYASSCFRDVLKRHGFIQSMSSKGNCYDNAVAESFFASIKKERIYHERYETRESAVKNIFEYIEVFYNRIRRHSLLGNVSPVEFERKAALLT